MDPFSTLRIGLLGAWCPALGDSGTLVRDRTARLKNGAVTGASVSQAGMSFTGSGQFVNPWTAAESLALTGGAVNLSVTAWINPTTVASVASIASTLRSTGEPCTFQLEIGRTSGRLSYLQTGAAVSASMTAATLVANRWQFVAFTRSGSASSWSVRLAIGQVTQTFTVSEGTTTVNNGSFSIGRAGDFTSQNFSGLIDDVRIYGRELTVSELLLLSTQRGIGLVPTRNAVTKFPTTLYQNVGGVWKPTTPHVNVGGTWKTATPSIKVGGVWK